MTSTPAGAVALLRADLLAYGVAGRSPVRLAWAVLTHPGLTAVVLLRLQAAAWGRPVLRPLAPVLRTLNLALTGADVVSGAEVGPGLRVEHPSGIVIGHGARVGARCQLLHQTTLGERIGRDGSSTYPVLGDDVLVGAGAKILGAVHVGHGARVGANAVVLEDVPAGATVVGNPARTVAQQ
jgi:serine O-acetyltransferase